MKIVEKKQNQVLIMLNRKEVHLITSSLGEISNILDIEDCETRTGYSLEEFENLFYEFNILDDR
ncbi:hypothetical protein [Avibacterium paragallinarum]|uniref:Uncharacterized protein n=1 Tax=Avibacterium paragallinarum TaxID=728 RepID=A0AAE5TJM7_AVIPA|nr:hypothetical protein [Avibacterium paragallinarum]MEE3622280.1 hypothetical protein [Avibacterium paragallinarum]MEE3682052.1 hypothetical protein [Avibacterium paragallinarum]PXZ39871.1 hypothetical protein DM482_03825 [Avibacterium paragallinarum]PXZ41731.1 hypothetical protein DM481_05190 [Avibacterium paragallinarum]QZP14776.1 hypothetical protein K5O18_08000 [Avibacterium paragallinarum]